jgi:hypothetical protein
MALTFKGGELLLAGGEPGEAPRVRAHMRDRGADSKTLRMRCNDAATSVCKGAQHHVIKVEEDLGVRVDITVTHNSHPIAQLGKLGLRGFSWLLWLPSSFPGDPGGPSSNGMEVTLPSRELPNAAQ